MLNSHELTGRARTHVLESPELQSTLHREALAGARALQLGAREAGLDLAIVSSFRDFARQQSIWNGKFRGERVLNDSRGRPIDPAGLDIDGRIDAILVWSALPGASRHHWGTDIDVVDRAHAPAGYEFRLTQEEFAAGGPCALLDRWLAANMTRFGFFRPYQTDRGGVRPEPWHLSFAPVAARALQALSLDTLAEAIGSSEMLGKEQVLVRLPELYGRYVMAIDPAPQIAVSAAVTRPS